MARGLITRPVLSLANAQLMPLGADFSVILQICHCLRAKLGQCFQFMNALESLRSTLAAYFAAIEAQRNGQPNDLTRAVLELEKFSVRPDPSFPAPLRHYLESRSYRKAWEFLTSV